MSIDFARKRVSRWKFYIYGAMHGLYHAHATHGLVTYQGYSVELTIIFV